MSEIADGVVDVLADDRYRLWSRAEIVALLRDLMERRSLVTAGGDGASFVTAIIGVNPEFEELLLDWGGDHRGHRARAALDARRVRDDAGPHPHPLRRRARRGGHRRRSRRSASASVTRLQRRESYRLRMPLSVKATCEAPAPAGKPAPALRLHDLSETGIAITSPKGCAAAGAIASTGAGCACSTTTRCSSTSRLSTSSSPTACRRASARVSSPCPATTPRRSGGSSRASSGTCARGPDRVPETDFAPVVERQIGMFMMSWGAPTTRLRTCTSCWNDRSAFCTAIMVSSRPTDGSPLWKRAPSTAAVCWDSLTPAMPLRNSSPKSTAPPAAGAARL